MKPLVSKLTTLTDDLLQLVSHWKDNTSRTPEQLKCWPGDKIIEFAGNDHPNALRLLQADGFDGLPVFKNHSCQQIMEAAANRELLDFTPEDVFRLSLFFHLNDIKTIVLLVKAQWESFLVGQTNRIDIDWLNKVGVAEDYLPAFMENEEAAQELSETWGMLDKWFGVSQKRGLAPELYSSVINQIIISRTFYFAIESSEMASFVESQNELLELLKSESSAYNDIYHARNKQWLNLLQTAENAHIRLEDQRLQNAENERQWMSVFGDAWYELTKADLKYQSLKRQIELKKKNPEMSVEQIEEADRAIMEAELEQLKNMETAITISQIFAQFESEGTPETQVDKELMDRYKKVLRTIWLKTHPDKVADKGFTPEQLEVLRNFYRQATEMNAAERLVNPLTLERLENLLLEVEELYSNMGLNINLNTTIKGNTLKEKVEWLEKQIKLIESELTQLKNELYSLVNDATIKQKAESMRNTETIALVKKQMHEKYKELSKMTDILNRDLEKLFEA